MSKFKSLATFLLGLFLIMPTQTVQAANVFTSHATIYKDSIAASPKKEKTCRLVSEKGKIVLRCTKRF
jgi:hypothetical protein